MKLKFRQIRELTGLLTPLVQLIVLLLITVVVGVITGIQLLIHMFGQVIQQRSISIKLYVRTKAARLRIGWR